MPKKGSDRSAKFSAKHDPFVIMLRIKALQNSMKQDFQIPAVQQTYVDENVSKLADEMELPFGQRAVLSDLTKRFVWKILRMNDLELEDMHILFISKGFTEDQYAIWLEGLYAKNSEITVLYNFCHLEKDKVFIRLAYAEPYNVTPKLDISVERSA